MELVKHLKNQYDEREKYFLEISIKSEKASISEIFNMPLKYIDTMIEIINEINSNKQNK